MGFVQKLLRLSFFLVCVVQLMGIEYMEKICLADNPEDTVYISGETQLKDMDFSDIEEFMEDRDELNNLSFTEMIKNILSGKSESMFESFFVELKKSLLSELNYSTDGLKRIIVISIFAAIFMNLTAVLKNRMVSETGFNVAFLIVMSICFSVFVSMSLVATDTIEELKEFMKALLPVYMVSFGVVEGQAGAAAFYKVALVIILIVDYVCLKLILPAINIYMISSLADGLSNSEMFSRVSEMIEKLVGFMIKLCIAAVMGINVIQAMLLPINGNIKNVAAKSVINILTGSTNMTSSITGVLCGTGTLIKNSIGTAGLIIILVIVSAPIIKLLVFIAVYEITLVILQPISDKRIVNGLNVLVKSVGMLMRTVAVATLMFIITTAIICMVR